MAVLSANASNFGLWGRQQCAQNGEMGHILRPRFPDGATEEVPEHVSIAERVLCTFELRGSLGHASQVARKQLHHEHNHERVCSPLLAGEHRRWRETVSD